MIEVIAFDADDKLWQNESLFQETQARLTAILDSYAPHAEVEARLAETERRNIKLFGYGIKGFTLSMVETAIEISGHRISAEEIHEIGLAEVARIRADMEATIAETGFEGSFDEFLTFLRTDPQFYAETPEELMMFVAWVAVRANATLGDVIGTLPRRRLRLIHSKSRS